jgi:hypothetical protein
MAFNKAFTKNAKHHAFDADVLFARLSSSLAFLLTSIILRSRLPLHELFDFAGERQFMARLTLQAKSRRLQPRWITNVHFHRKGFWSNSMQPQVVRANLSLTKQLFIYQPKWGRSSSSNPTNPVFTRNPDFKRCGSCQHELNTSKTESTVTANR